MSDKKIKRITLEDYISNNESPFYDNQSPLVNLVPDFITDNSFQTVLSSVIDMQYGGYYLRDKYTLVPHKVKADIMAWYAANAYKYKGLFDTTQLDYDPIENYRMREEGEDVREGTDDTTHEYGTKNTTTTEGERKDNETLGNHTDSTIHSVSPYEQTGFTNKSKDDTSYADRSNNFTKGSMTSTIKEDGRQDKDTKSFGDSTKHNLTRSGNIGVTTSQQMIEAEREVRNFSIYIELAKDIMMLLCIRAGLEHKYIVVND